jgi:hypothetical protein
MKNVTAMGLAHAEFSGYVHGGCQALWTSSKVSLKDPALLSQAGDKCVWAGRLFLPLIQYI